MSLSDYDRMLLDRCLQGAPRAWEDFVDRFLGLVVHVVGHSAKSRGFSIDAATRDDLVSDVFIKLIESDFAVLRRFRRQCSLATYLAVVARRVVLRRMTQLRLVPTVPPEELDGRALAATGDDPETRIENRDQVEQIMLRLDGRDAEIVRMYHLEGKSYREISATTGMAENSIGPALSRARALMRQSGV